MHTYMHMGLTQEGTQEVSSECCFWSTVTEAQMSTATEALFLVTVMQAQIQPPELSHVPNNRHQHTLTATVEYLCTHAYSNRAT